MATGGTVRELDFIEACYDPLSDDSAWAVALAERCGRLVPGAKATMAASYEVRAGGGGRLLDIKGDGRFMDAGFAACSLNGMRVINATPERALLQLSYALPAPSVSALSSLPQPYQARMREQMPWPSGDYLGLFGTLDGQRGYQLCPGGPQLMKPSPRRQAQLLRLCEHLAAGFWLRRLRAEGRAPDEATADAVLTPDGSTLSQRPLLPTPARQQLIEAVRAMDRARCRRRQRTPEEATQLWQALVGGQYALVESFERNGRRLMLAVRCRYPQPVLSEREGAVARRAADGYSNKQIGAELGLATGTVGVHLSSALRKLRCPNRKLLVDWLAAAAQRR